jgi:hypothetical protein
MSTGPAVPPPPPKSGSNVLLIILVIGGILLLVCGGICAGCMVVAGRTAKQAGDAIAGMLELGPAMDQTVSAVTADEQVKAKLGEPVELLGIPTREGTGEINAVHEAFHFDVRGPNGTAKVTGHATKVEGMWKITQIDVEASDGEKIQVTPPEAPAMELNFDTEMPDVTIPGDPAPGDASPGETPPAETK